MLPYIPYGDNISAYSQTGFGGINHNPSAADGELYRVKNLTSDLYPLLSSRPERVPVTTLTKANGLFAKEKLAWVDGTNFYYDNELIGQVADSPKTLPRWAIFCSFSQIRNTFSPTGRRAISMTALAAWKPAIPARPALSALAAAFMRRRRPEANSITTTGEPFPFRAGDAVTDLRLHRA